MAEKLYLLLVASLPIVRPLTIDISRFYAPATDIFFVGAAASLATTVVLGRRRFVWDRFYVPLAFYVLALALSILLSDDERASVVKLFGTAYLAGLSILTVNVVRSWAFLRRVLYAWIAGTAITVFFGVLCVVFFYAGWRDWAEVFGLTRFGSLPAGPYPRGMALFLNMNMLCNYLIPSLLIVLAMRALGWLAPLWSRLLTAGIWITAIFTVSGGLGGLALAAAEWRRRRTPGAARVGMDRLLYGGAVLLAVAIFIPTLVLPAPRVVNARSSSPDSDALIEIAPRVFLWRSAVEIFLAHPIVGQGLGTPSASYEFVTLSGERQRLADAHNTVLSIAAQGGLIALAAFAAIGVSLARRCLAGRGGNEPAAAIQTAFGLSLAGALGYHGLMGSFEDTRHLWVVAGLVVALSRGLEGDVEPSPSS